MHSAWRSGWNVRSNTDGSPLWAWPVGIQSPLSVYHGSNCTWKGSQDAHVKKVLMGSGPTAATSQWASTQFPTMSMMELACTAHESQGALANNGLLIQPGIQSINCAGWWWRARAQRTGVRVHGPRRVCCPKAAGGNACRHLQDRLANHLARPSHSCAAPCGGCLQPWAAGSARSSWWGCWAPHLQRGALCSSGAAAWAHADCVVCSRICTSSLLLHATESRAVVPSNRPEGI